MKIPTFLRQPNVLVPLKIDMTYKGARLVDTFCWDLYESVMLPEEFAARMCADLNLPVGYHERISLQMTEQIAAYQEVIDCIYKYGSAIPDWDRKVSQIQPITVGVRNGNVDYSDRIDWDPMAEHFTPEDFASLTCSDLGLPIEMEPAIAHKIRESLFRWIITVLQNPTVDDVTLRQEFPIPENKVVLVPNNQTVDMITNLWKRAKPNHLDEIAVVPQPQLPVDKESNAESWTKVKLGQRTDETRYSSNKSGIGK